MPDSYVVTGAGQGIGAAIVHRLLRDEENRVVAVDVAAEPLGSSFADEPTVRTVVGDARDTTVLQAAATQAEQMGVLQGWVNNAGIVRLASAHEMTDEHLDEVVGVNLRAVMVGARTALQSFLRNSVAGSIVNISSIHAQAAFPRYCAYDVTKAGIEALTRNICVDYGHLGIRCNAVAPGAVATNIVQSPDDSRVDLEQEREETRAFSPLHRISSPAEIADAVAFLLSQDASSITGHVLAVDNGMSAWSFGFPPSSDITFG